jgi:hypothetical protein
VKRDDSPQGFRKAAAILSLPQFMKDRRLEAIVIAQNTADPTDAVRKGYMSTSLVTVFITGNAKPHKPVDIASQLT